MSQLVENYVDRYIKRYHAKMKQICEPLQRCFGINYFTYHSITADGYWRPFVSRLDWADYFTENKLYLQDFLLRHPDCYQTGALFWTHYIQDPHQQDLLNMARDKFKMAHGFCMIEKNKEGCEFFGFTAPPGHEQIYSTYLHDTPLLKEFCKYFKQEAASVLKLIDHDPIRLLDFPETAFQNRSAFPFEKSSLPKSLFLKYIQAEPQVKLSKREKECLNHYIDDLRMQDVANKLGLSVRTIEFYLGNIKNKLNCWNKTELIKKGQELRSLGLLA